MIAKRNSSMRKLLVGLMAIGLLAYVAVISPSGRFHMTRDRGIEHRFEVEQLENELEASQQLLELGLTPRVPIKVVTNSGKMVKKLHGRFLHITDIHPDPYYSEGSSASSVCHRGKPDGKHDEAVRFGVAMAGCDSSMDLMDYTFKWIDENLRDQIDFVIWTGDNIRHDNDRSYPRTEAQIFDLNELVSKKFQEVFRRKGSADPRDFDVNVIPSLGNNDVFPHNLFALGPTLQTREFYNIWSNFIPQEQQRAFARGTSFFVEVIPGKLAVLSLNTLYLYKANPLVDNCNSKKEPGYQILLWLGYVLEELRARGMKVWLSGHVPPLLKNFDQSCYDKFTLWTHEYRDVIIGGVYGHMNIDHFIPTDSKKAWKSIGASELVENQLKLDEYNFKERVDGDHDDEDDDDDDSFLEAAMAASDARIMGAKPVNKDAYMQAVRRTYYDKIASRFSGASEEKNKKKTKKNKKNKANKDKNMERYGIVNVAASVIPTFNPGFRVWEYNISGLDALSESNVYEHRSWDEFFEEMEYKLSRDLAEDDDQSGFINSALEVFKGAKKSKRKVDKTIPEKMPKDLQAGPGYTPQLFSPTRFVQYYADLKGIDRKYKTVLESGVSRDEAADKAFKYEVEYTSDSDPYPMKSLLTKDYIDLAVRLSEDDKLWRVFSERAFCSSGYKD